MMKGDDREIKKVGYYKEKREEMMYSRQVALAMVVAIACHPPSLL